MVYYSNNLLRQKRYDVQRPVTHFNPTFEISEHPNHAFQCNCYLNLYHVVPTDPSRTAVHKRVKIYNLYFKTICNDVFILH